MPMSESPLAYRDVQEAFDRALANGKGIRLRFLSRGRAKSIQSRAYKFRSVDRAENKKIYDPDDPMYGRSVYDNILLSLKQGGDFWYLILECSTAERFDALMETLDEPLPPAATPEPEPPPKLTKVPQALYPSLLKRSDT